MEDGTQAKYQPTLKNWSAKRAGSGITITGVFEGGPEAGRPTKLTGVDEITVRSEKVVAVQGHELTILLPREVR